LAVIIPEGVRALFSGAINTATAEHNASSNANGNLKLITLMIYHFNICI
jgi:hypothetical protein